MAQVLSTIYPVSYATGTTTPTIASIPIGSGAGRHAVVFISMNAASGHALPATITLGSVTLTALGAETTQGNVEMRAYAGNVSGISGSQTLSFTITGGASAGIARVGVHVEDGAAGTTTGYTVASASNAVADATAELTVPSESGDTVVVFYGGEEVGQVYTSLTLTGATETDDDLSDATLYAIMGRAAGAASVATVATFSPASFFGMRWVAMGVNLDMGGGATPTLTSYAPSSGPVGTVVTMTGTNLTGSTGATIGGLSLTSFSVTNATTAVGTIPSGATTNTIIIANPGGNATGPTFTVTAPPTVSSIAPTSGAIGTSVTITGTNLTGATNATINGTAITSRVVVNATTITGVVASGTTTGAVVVTTPVGTSTGGPTFTVVAPVLTSLEITNPNTEYTLGVTLSPITIRARDQFGATWLGAIADATVSALTLPVTVTGTLTRPFVSGIATFNDLVPTSSAPAVARGFRVLMQYYTT